MDSYFSIPLQLLIGIAFLLITVSVFYFELFNNKNRAIFILVLGSICLKLFMILLAPYLFAWDEATFNAKMAGSAIYRIGHEQWLRNIAIGLGNAPSSTKVIEALQSRINDASSLVREHVAWALQQHHITV